MGDTTQIGRLAFRHEGNLWNAYYALPDTMDDALFLGSVQMGAVTGNPKIRQGFIDLMRSIVSGIIEDGTGQRPSWDSEQRAPEHERAGHS